MQVAHACASVWHSKAEEDKKTQHDHHTFKQGNKSKWSFSKYLVKTGWATCVF